MKFFRVAALALAGLGLTGEAAPDRYAEGQVWEYRARPQDVGSLVRIQKIEAQGGRPVYHVSVSMVRYGKFGDGAMLPHLPVSAATLDASVTRRAPRGTAFPAADFEAGIAEWRRAEGGIFTIPLREIADIIDQQLQ